MRLAELARESGCSVATVKYYLREGLLPAGRLLRATEAEYDEHHLARLRMIRVLRELGGLSIADIAQVVAAIDDESMPLPQKLASAYYALPPHPLTAADEGNDAHEEAIAYARSHGWDVSPEAPSVMLFAEALAAARTFWGPVGPEIFDRYAAAFDTLAQRDVAVLDDVEDPADAVRQVVAGTVVWDRAIVALRRLAADHYSTRRFGGRDRGA